MKKYQLGEFEEVVLLTVGVLYDEAYGVSIKKEIEARLSRGVSVGALQTALKRLEDKGYLKSRDGEATERSEEHTSELQSLTNLVCRLLLEKKKKSPGRWEVR